ncbi:hypothetical protein [Streptomyces sp. Ag82_O1-15]|uniref:hypothetical protein n=1 Tax=Streptomyces sp. Ag82_O1-15 TaxID=1938855 RepID=UPI00268BA731|nr:hypothetical protein [Streptomyces sp. Ag82_O1-15]
MELLSTLTRRQYEHRARIVSRLTAVLDADLLPADLQEMVLYYGAKALRDTGRAAQSRRDYQQVADQGGRLAPAARRSMAHAARLAGDFPTALAAAQNLGWEGRHQRVLGDLYWLQGQPQRAAAAYLAGRTEAEQHGKAGARGDPLGPVPHHGGAGALSGALHQESGAQQGVPLSTVNPACRARAHVSPSNRLSPMPGSPAMSTAVGATGCSRPLIRISRGSRSGPTMRRSRTAGAVRVAAAQRPVRIRPVR